MVLAGKIIRIKKDDDCLKWAIVGTGYMATTWADTLLMSKIGVLHAVCSRSLGKSEAFGQKFGCSKAYCGVEALLVSQADELDFVYVATPLKSHYPIIKRCIEAGVNVLTEKPATECADEWSELAKMAKQHDVLLIEGMWMRCLPTFRQAETWIEEGEIGKVTWIKAELNKFQIPFPGQLREDTGVLMDYGVYALYFACHFLGGQPEWINSYGRQDSNGDDADWMIAAGKDEKTAVINISSNFHSASRAAVVGEDGLIEWGSPFNRTSNVVLHCFRSGNQNSKEFVYQNQGFEHQLAEVTRTQKEGLKESRLLSHQMTLSTLGFAEEVQNIARERRC